MRISRHDLRRTYSNSLVQGRRKRRAEIAFGPPPPKKKIIEFTQFTINAVKFETESI